MNATDIRNGAGALLALAAAVAVMLPRGEAAQRSNVIAATTYGSEPLEFRDLPPTDNDTDGAAVRGLVDASGTAVALRDYRRIVAGSTVAREVLIELLEPGRLAAIVDYDLDVLPDRHRFAGIVRIASAKDVEPLLALSPDLVVVHGMGDQARLARMREAGLRVFDLGTMRGRGDFEGSVMRLGHLVGAPERATRLLDLFDRRFAAIAADIPADERKTAIYATAYGDRVFGGTRGSSFYDVLTAAGLIDAAADAYEGWPRYAPEDLLMLDPDIIVTQQGKGEAMCALPGASQLRACADGRRGIVEAPRHVLNTPGLSMLEAAEILREAVYGAR